MRERRQCSSSLEMLAEEILPPEEEDEELACRARM
jgi:hypothetical protein